ncbi:MAG: hypothetical protein AVDCRST_MAG30-197, partial [uncultured Solirubrobacteraceae bacterium]
VVVARLGHLVEVAGREQRAADRLREGLRERRDDV